VKKQNITIIPPNQQIILVMVVPLLLHLLGTLHPIHQQRTPETIPLLILSQIAEILINYYPQ
jgi:hypothetical protein